MDGDNQQKAVVFSGKSKHFFRLPKLSRRSRKIGKYLLPVLLIAIGIGCYVVYQHNEARVAKNICNGREDNNFYKQVGPLLYPRRYEDLKTKVDIIQRSSTFEKDTNCLYPMFYYYAVIGDIKNARIYYAKLESAYKTNKGFVSAYKHQITNLEQAKEQMDTAEKSNKAFEKGILYSR